MRLLATSFALALLVLVSACAQPADETEIAEPAPPAEEEVAPADASAAMLNANLASEEDLEAILGATLAGALVDARPLLSLTEVYDALAGASDHDTAIGHLASVSVPIDLNAAPGDEIGLIPGVGDRMIHEFEEYRPYVAIEQFRREIGKYVDDEEVARLEQYVFVPVNLNTASDEAILAIPGVGDRMLHEFKEYRPYVDIAQFQREIGKYVDDDELARLERYVTL